MANDLKKRRKKIRKHKHKKRLKRNRHKRKK
ncbi:AURKAIP1/COX24 domain-containing protein [bacterium]|nr:AURKAIP1/COX24 domain-containing protein [Bdellovibrionales bacterium]NBW41653.1 AURKAIP1/COX24 domain-containing protein [bacterium]